MQTLVAFISNSFLALACVFLNSIFFSAGTDDKTNGIDRWFFAKAKRLTLFHITTDQRLFWQPILRKIVITLSDQQFLTGLAILSAGLWEHCSISVYHFNLILDLGLFSSATHLVAITHLAPHLQRDKMRRNLLVFLMVTKMALLVPYIAMRSHKHWYFYWTTPAQCLFGDLIGNTSLSLVAFQLFALWYAYVSKIIILYERGHEACRKWLLVVPTAVLDKCVEIMRRRASFRQNAFSLLLETLLLVQWLVLGILALLTSWCITYLSILTWFAVGTWVIVMDRSLAASRIIGNENDLTFGQWVPIFLLCSNAIVFRDSYYGEILDQAEV